MPKMNWHAFMSVVKLVLPMVAPMLPGGGKIAPIADKVIAAIGAAEKIPGASGPEKRAYVQRIAAEGAGVSALVAPNHPVEPNTVSEVAGQVIDVTIAITKIVEKAQNSPVVAVVPAGPPAVPELFGEGRTTGFSSVLPGEVPAQASGAVVPLVPGLPDAVSGPDGEA